MTSQSQQVDAITVINALTAEIAALMRRAVIAEQHAAALEEEIAKAKESK